jgi:hypothetical protein
MPKNPTRRPQNGNGSKKNDIGLLEFGKDVDLLRARREARQEFDHPDESIADAFIEIGKSAAPEEIAERSGVAEARVRKLLNTKKFWKLLRRRLIQKNFDGSRLHEWVNECMHNLMQEYWVKTQEDALEDASPELLAKRMQDLQKIDKSQAQVEMMRSELAAGRSGGHRRCRNPNEAFAQLVAEENQSFKFFLERRKLQESQSSKDRDAIDVEGTEEAQAG